MSDILKEIQSVADKPQGYVPGPVYDILAKASNEIERIEKALEIQRESTATFREMVESMAKKNHRLEREISALRDSQEQLIIRLEAEKAWRRAGSKRYEDS